MIPEPDPRYGSYGVIGSNQALSVWACPCTGTVSVYVTWDPNADATAYGYTGWTNDACYQVWGDCEGNWHNVLSSQDVDQTQSPAGTTVANGVPWLYLGTFTDPGDWAVSLQNNKVGSGVAAQFGLVLVLPVQPTVSIQAVARSNPQVAAANASAYANWQDSWEPVPIPVEGQGDRTELGLCRGQQCALERV